MKLKIENSYKADYKKGLKQHTITDDIANEINDVISTLLEGKTLDLKYKDHSLQGDYKGYRDCHLRGDLLLIYKISNDELRLVRIGTHTMLFKKY